LLCTIIANVNRDKKTKKSPYKISDFMPKKAPANKQELIKKIKQLKTGI
jgi:type III secretory pathway lipoprotein EscJ